MMSDVATNNHIEMLSAFLVKAGVRYSFGNDSDLYWLEIRDTKFLSREGIVVDNKTPCDDLTFYFDEKQKLKSIIFNIDGLEE